jgi:hypothetical protein
MRRPHASRGANDAKPPSVERESTDERSRQRAPYSAPVLERIGNVRDIARKTGLSRDNPRPHPRRP